MDSKEYVYSPLRDPQEIRLLHLLPGPDHEGIRCNITHHLLDQLPNSQSYQAVSYEWGVPGQFSFIEVDSKRHRIQRNLFTFLKVLRSISNVRVLWADAASINQSDVQERQQQVAIMRKIFRQADSVLSWLGPAADGSDLAFDFCNELKQGRDPNPDLQDTWSGKNWRLVSSNTWNSQQSEDKTISDTTEMSDEDLKSNFSTLTTIASPSHDAEHQADPEICKIRMTEESGLVAEQYKALTALRNRTYWQRLWIVPEVAVARDVQLHCGEKRMPWSAIKPAFELIEERRKLYLLEEHKTIPNSLPNSFNDLVRYRSDDGKLFGWSLHKLLEAFGQLQCSEIRDRVYALLGTKTTFRANRVSVVDYTCDLEELFFDVLVFCTEMSTCKNSITFCSRLQKILELTPEQCLSWVADRCSADQRAYFEHRGLLSLDEMRQLGKLTYQSRTTDLKYGDHCLSRLHIKHSTAEILTTADAKTGDVFYELHHCSAGAIYRCSSLMKHSSRVKDLLHVKQQHETFFVGIGVRLDLVPSEKARVLFDSFKDRAKLSRMCGFEDRQTLNDIGREEPCKVRLSYLALVILSMCILPE